LDPVDNDLASFFAGRGLTPREIEVVGLVLQGRSNKDIEKALFISIHTVKNHLYKIYQKLGVRSRFQVVAMVREGKNGSLENGGDEPLNS
jgi:DNA-binding CsgD family transcriptional regulator